MANIYDVRFKCPMSLICAGPSYSGKTSFVRRILKYKEHIFAPEPPGYIIYITGSTLTSSDQTLLDENLVDELSQAIPTENELYDKAAEVPSGILVIFDDCLNWAEKNDSIKNLFVRGRHANVSTIFITQNLFSKGPNYRTISLNASYIAIFQNIRDKTQILHFARQFAPQNISFVMQSYLDATKVNFGYLLIDMRMDSSEDIRLRTNLFAENGDPGIVVYQDPTQKLGI